MDPIQQNKLFEGLAEKDFPHLEKLIQVRPFPKDTVLMEEGQQGDALFLLLSGSVKVLRATAQDREVVLTVRHAGDFFGEMALIDDAPRSAKVVTMEACTLGLIGKDNFNAMMHEQPTIAFNIVRTISARLRLSNDQMMTHFLERERLQTRQLERLHALFDLSKGMTGSRDYTGLIHLVPEMIRRHLRVDQVLFYIRDEASGRLFAADPDHGELQVTPDASWAQTPGDFSEVPPTHPVVMACLPRHTEGPRGTVWSCALRTDDHLDGLLLIERPAGLVWPEEDRAFLTALMSYLEVSLANIRLTHQMVTIEKLSAVGRASSSFLHDCKNLISVVHNYAYLIRRSTDLSEVAGLVDEIMESTRLMMSMSREVLSFAQGDIRLSRQPVDVQALIERVTALIRDDVSQKQIVLQKTVEPGLTYPFDQDKIIRALYNLLINACQAVDAGAGQIQIRAGRTGPALEFTVTDNGRGVPPDVLPRIFVPFVTTKQEGTGLGLPIVKSIVEAHGGRMRVRSEVGRGTEFVMSFPWDPS